MPKLSKSFRAAVLLQMGASLFLACSKDATVGPPGSAINGMWAGTLGGTNPSSSMLWLTQSGSTVAGRVVAYEPGSGGASEFTVTGSVAGNAIAAQVVTQCVNPVLFSVSLSGDSLTGQYSYVKSSSTDCGSDTAQVRLHRVIGGVTGLYALKSVNGSGVPIDFHVTASECVPFLDGSVWFAEGMFARTVVTRDSLSCNAASRLSSYGEAGSVTTTSSQITLALPFPDSGGVTTQSGVIAGSQLTMSIPTYYYVCAASSCNLAAPSLSMVYTRQ